MSLIKCPECGKEISDQAEHCIYCGFLLSKIPKFEHSIWINGQEYDASSMLKDIEDYKKGKIDIKVLRECLGVKVWECNRGLTIGSIFTLVDTITKTLEIPKEFNGVIPKCPTCSSTNIRKLGFFETGYYCPKTFVCNNCGYKW